MNLQSTSFLLVVPVVIMCQGCTEFADEAASAAPPAEAATVRLTFKPSGLTKIVAGPIPQRISLTATRSQTITKEPEGLIAPRYGTLPFGVDQQQQPASQPMHVLIDDRPDDPRMYIDFNRNGDLTDDAKPDWAKGVRDGGAGRQITMLDGGAELEFAPGGVRGRVNMYRFERDARRSPDSQDFLFYYRDYFSQGQATLGDRSFNIVLVDDLTRGDFRGDRAQRASGVRLFIDTNNDNRYDPRAESFDIARPFNIGGTTYEIANMSPSGETFEIVKSAQRVAELGKPIDHSVGKLITPFESLGLDGQTVRFPDDFAGKIVLLDFWATWCMPCMKEMPHLVRAYDNHRQSGLEILGVNLDTPKTSAGIKSALDRNKMTWPQVNDLSIGELYRISSIPKAYLVDGSTGQILAAGDLLRGEALHVTIAKFLAERTATKN